MNAESKTKKIYRRNCVMLMPNEEHNCRCEPGVRRRTFRIPDPLAVPTPLHRIAEVRRQQGISLRAVRQSLGLGSDQVHEQEKENYDLLLSELYRWQQALDVPTAELLVEPAGQLSQPVLARASMIKVMKTAATILESSHDPGILTLAHRLIDQLIDVMPELAGVSAWPAVGQRRTLEEMGRIAQHPISIAPLDDY
jgi:transcriptional regulator with XRE-family HTH domain